MLIAIICIFIFMLLMIILNSYQIFRTNSIDRSVKTIKKDIIEVKIDIIELKVDVANLKKEQAEAKKLKNLESNLALNCENKLFFLLKKTKKREIRSVLTKKKDLLHTFALSILTADISLIQVITFYNKLNNVFIELDVYIKSYKEISNYDDGTLTRYLNEFQQFKDECAAIILKGNGKRPQQFSDVFFDFYNLEMDRTYTDLKYFINSTNKGNYDENIVVIKDNLLILLSNSELPELFVELDSFIVEYQIELEQKKNFYLLRGRWTTLMNKNQLGIIDNSEYTLELNKIRSSLQELIIEIFITI